MINAELSYNPYLMETQIRFNGQPPRINSLVEKYQNMSLQSWISRIPKIFYDEMNGYYFELEFTGTELDYEALCNTFRRAGITNEIVPIIHRHCLEDRITKQNEMEELLEWLGTNPNRRFDYDGFRAENSELFDGSYSYVYLHGRGLDETMLEDMNVSVEHVEKVEELNDTELDFTPILIHITDHTLSALEAELAYFKARKDVTEEQLFFSIGGTLDKMTIERVIRDLGVVSPKVVDTPADQAVRRYIEVYPITDYVRKSLNILRVTANDIGENLERDIKESVIKNQEIHERIFNINDILDRLGKARAFYNGYPDSAPSGYMKEMGEELLNKVNNWRGRKTKINKFEEAVSEAGEFERDVKKLVMTYGIRTRKDMENKINGLGRDFEAEYKNAQYDDFEPATKPADLPEIGGIESFAQELLGMKEEKYVESKEDLIGLFFKGRQSEEKEMVLETTYYYKKWRDYVSELVKKVVGSYEEQLKIVYKEYFGNLRNEYLQHIDEAVKQEELKRNEVESQLSEDEKMLQNDNMWLAKFNEQRVAIERG